MLENPENAMAISPAVTSAMGVPLKHFGVSLNATLSLTKEKITIARVNPSAEPKLKTIDGRKEYSFCMQRSAEPSMAQLVVMSGRYIPSAE